MSIFEPSTPVDESPETGYEEETADTFENEQHEEITEETTEDYQEHDEEQEEEPSQEEHGDLFAGKYKSVDDLVAGYKNLERQFHQSRQQPQAQQQVQQVPQDQNVDNNEVFWDLFRDNPLNTLQFIVDSVVSQKTAPIYEQRENEILAKNYQNVSKEYGQMNTEDGMTQVFERVQEIAQELGNPKLASNPTQRILKMAAQELFGESNAQLYQKAKQAGRAEAEASRMSKQGLAAPAGAKVKEQPKSIEDTIRESIINAGRRGGIFK